MTKTKGDQPLLDAVFGNEHARAFALLESGTDWKGTFALGLGPRKLTLLHGACVGTDDSGELDVRLVGLLLDRGAALEATTSTGETALMIALQYERWPIAELLLARGANPLAVDARGISVLHWACARPHAGASAKAAVEFAKTLLARGADPAAACRKPNPTYWVEKGDTALTLATRGKNQALVKLLER